MLGEVIVVVSSRVKLLVKLFVGRGVGVAVARVLWVVHLAAVSMDVRVKMKETADVGAAWPKRAVASSRAKQLNIIWLIPLRGRMTREVKA